MTVNHETDNVQLFGEKGIDYHQYRPGYPFSVWKFVFEELKLSGKMATNKVIADIATGTGFLTEQLAGVAKVIAIDPGETMRSIAEKNLQSRKGQIDNLRRRHHKNINNSEVRHGTSDNTGMYDKSIDGIVSGTAAHWFVKELEGTLKEWDRILKPSGKVALIFNFLDKSDPATKVVAETYEHTFDVNWQKLDLYNTEVIAEKFIAQKSQKSMEDHFTFTANKENYLQWLGTMSGPSRKDFTREQEEALTKVFDANCVDGEKGEKVIKILYKSTAFVGELKGRDKQKQKRGAAAIIEKGTGREESSEIKI